MNNPGLGILKGAIQGKIPLAGIYSVWDWTNGRYNYYQSPEHRRPRYGDEVQPPKPNNSLGSVLGEEPDHSGNSLPRNAKFLGSGHRAMGEVVSSVESELKNPWIAVVLAIAIPTAILWVTTRILPVGDEQ